MTKKVRSECLMRQYVQMQERVGELRHFLSETLPVMANSVANNIRRMEESIEHISEMVSEAKRAEEQAEFEDNLQNPPF